MNGPQSSVERPADICPNCWGYYEYENKIREEIYEEELAVHNHETVRSFIRQWVTKYLEGIRLKRDHDELICHNCHTRYPFFV